MSLTPVDTELSPYNYPPKNFLSEIYGINNLEDCVSYVSNYQLPIITLKRIHEYSWKILGTNENALTFKVIKFYYKYFTEIWDNIDSIKIQKEYFSHPKILIDQVKKTKLNHLVSLEKFKTDIVSFFTDYKNQWKEINNHLSLFNCYLYNKNINM